MTTQTPSIFRARLKDPHEHLPLFVGQDPLFTLCAAQGRAELARYQRLIGNRALDPKAWVERLETDKHGQQRVQRVAQLSGKRGA